MKNSEILINARKVIEKPENWTKRVLATDSTGKKVYPLSEKAVCFCSIGAVERASGFNYRKIGSIYNNDCVELLNRAVVKLKLHSYGHMWLFNDRPDTKHEDVLKVFDEAIELAKEIEK